MLAFQQRLFEVENNMNQSNYIIKRRFVYEEIINKKYFIKVATSEKFTKLLWKSGGVR